MKSRVASRSILDCVDGTNILRVTPSTFGASLGYDSATNRDSFAAADVGLFLMDRNAARRKRMLRRNIFGLPAHASSDQAQCENGQCSLVMPKNPVIARGTVAWLRFSRKWPLLRRLDREMVECSGITECHRASSWKGTNR